MKTYNQLKQESLERILRKIDAKEINLITILNNSDLLQQEAIHNFKILNEKYPDKYTYEHIFTDLQDIFKNIFDTFGANCVYLKESNIFIRAEDVNNYKLNDDNLENCIGLMTLFDNFQVNFYCS